MNECKHYFSQLKDDGKIDNVKCENCGMTYYQFLIREIMHRKKENADLRAKLETAEKERDSLQTQCTEWKGKYERICVKHADDIDKIIELEHEQLVFNNCIDDLQNIALDDFYRAEQLQAQCAAMRQALEAIRGGIICGNCSEYTVRAGDDREEPSAFCELNPKKYQIGCGSCEEWHADSNAGVLAHQALSATAGADILTPLRETEEQRDRYKIKLDSIAVENTELITSQKALRLALQAAHNGNDTDDLRYSYDPEQGIEQLETLVNGVIVHIPVEWLLSIAGNFRLWELEKTARYAIDVFNKFPPRGQGYTDEIYKAMHHLAALVKDGADGGN